MRTLIHKLLRRMGFYGTIETDKIIRQLKVENLRLKKQIEEEIQRRITGMRTLCSTCIHQRYEPIGKVAIYVDPRIKQQGEEQQPTTQVQSPRQRHITRQLYPHTGDRARHVSEMQRKNFAAGQEQNTERLPKPPQPRKPRFYKLHASPDSTFNAL